MNRILLLVLLAGVAVSPAWTRRLHPEQYEGGRSKDALSAARRNSSALGRILGEYRSASSDVLLMKTEYYLHAGVGYEMHVVNNPQAMSISSGMAETDAHAAPAPAQAGAAPSGLVPLIRPREQDFRGFLGDWHRQVKPWYDPSRPDEHTDGRELLPWFRVMTLNDPHYVRAYAMGAWWLMQENLAEALRFTEEGIRNNPDAFLLLLVRGELELARAKEANGGSLFSPSAEARPLFVTAADTFLAAARLAFRQRPARLEDLPEDDPWRIWMDTDAQRAVEMAALTRREYVDALQARNLAMEALRVYPQSGTLRRVATPVAPLAPAP